MSTSSEKRVANNFYHHVQTPRCLVIQPAICRKFNVSNETSGKGSEMDSWCWSATHILRQNVEILVTFRLTKMLTIHWELGRIWISSNLQLQWRNGVFNVFPKNAQGFGAHFKTLEMSHESLPSKIGLPGWNMALVPHRVRISFKRASKLNLRALLWRADSRRRILQINKNHSRNRRNISREIWVFRTPTKMAKHVILYQLHCKPLEVQKGVYFQIVNWFHGAGQKV